MNGLADKGSPASGPEPSQPPADEAITSAPLQAQRLRDEALPAPSAPPDWNLLRAFLAVVDAGSLTGAARQLATSQPTLSRQIGELESSLGVILFERVARGLQLTVAGQVLVPWARQMQQAAHGIALAALGQTQQLAGTVRLTASEMTSLWVLPPILVQLRRQHPQIQIELLVSNAQENLLERQADIAVRHIRPSQSGLVARKIGDAAMGAWAHSDYLQHMGGHFDLSRAAAYDWIGYDRSEVLLRAFRAAGIPAERDFFQLRCDNQPAGWQMALNGLGIAFATAHVARQAPGMQQVLGVEQVGYLPVWLTAHRELRHSARIRLVFDALALGLQRMVEPA